MEDRISTPGQEGRVLITPENGSPPFYATIAMADNPRQPGTPLNKANLLQDATAGLYGKDNQAVPNDLFAYLGKFAQYCWRRRKYTPEKIVEEVKSNFTIIMSNSTYRTVPYYRNLQIENSGQLMGTDMAVESGTDDSGDFGSSLRDLYFQPHLEAARKLYGGAFFKIPVNVTAAWTTNTGDPSMDIGIVCQSVTMYSGVAASLGEEEFVFSPNPGAYPAAGISGDYLYEKLGVPYELPYLDNLSIHFFSYVGQGRGYSTSKPARFTATKPMKLLCIYRKIKDARQYLPEGIIFMAAEQLFTSWSLGVGLGDAVDTYGRCSEDRKTFEWYSIDLGTSDYERMDESGAIYHGFYIS